MKFATSILATLLAVTMLAGCNIEDSADTKQRRAQESIQAQGVSTVGMPGIVNFREAKLLKSILELRDQDGLITYTYIVAENTGKLIFLCNSIGYGIPAATQFTNPQKIAIQGAYGHLALPQADPNGLFSPASAEGTWVMCANPEKGNEPSVMYVEPRVITSRFKLPT
jgi:hypothetical protein